MVSIPSEYKLRPILEALLDEVSTGTLPLIDRSKVEWMIQRGKPKP